MEKKVTTHIVKGLMLALILIVLSVVAHIMKFDLESWFGWTSMLIFCGGIIWAVIIYGKQMNDNVTFGNLFAHGFKTTAVVICIVFVFTVLSVYVLFPETIDQLMQKGVEEAKKQGKITDEQIQQSGDMMKKIITISLLAGSILINAIIGAVASVIGAAVAKKNPQSPFQQPM